jgi:hypothetical protein
MIADMTIADVYAGLGSLQEATEFGFKNANSHVDEHFDGLAT